MVQKQIHIFVTGRVQGVFFRQSTKVMAIKNNVKGWVRNLDDGRVEIVGEGEIQDIENLTQWCKTGPANSRVCLLYTSPSPRDLSTSRMPSSA